MAAKYQLITELYRRTGIAVAKNPQAWQSFLAAACRNYKCRCFRPEGSQEYP